MADVVCDACGELNSPDAEFCSACQAFLAWDGLPDADRTQRIDPRVAAAISQRLAGQQAGPASSAQQQPQAPQQPQPARSGQDPPDGDPAYRIVLPPGRTPPPPPEPHRDPAELLAVTSTPTTVEVRPTGEPVEVAVLIGNHSDIVDGYTADVPSRPPWLTVVGAEVRLLPGTEETVQVLFSLAPGTMIPAQQIRVPLRVRSTSHPAIEITTLITVAVPVVDGTLMIRLEPQVIRVRDAGTGQASVTIENRGGNKPTRVTLGGADPELAVGFAFTPPVLDVPPHGSVSAQLQLRAPTPAPGEESSRGFTVTVREGGRSAEAQGTFVQASSAVVIDPPVALRLEPSVVKVRDATLAELMLVADNRRGRRSAQLTLTGRDPERLVRFDFQPQVLVVPPGQTAAARVRVQAPPPEPGTESTRALTITGSDPDPAHAAVEVGGSFVQSSSPAVVDPPVQLRLDPEVVRISGFGGGSSTLTIDHRSGRLPTRIALSAHDPERLLRVDFQPPVVDIAPGSWAYVQLRVSSPRPEGGHEVTRPFTVVASDHDSSVERTGTVVHTAGDPRPWVRVSLVVLGAALMVAGVFLPWLVGTAFNLTGAEWTVQRFIAYSTINASLDFSVVRPLPDFLTSGGLVITLLAALMLFGLTGSKGRLIRLAAVLGLLAISAFVLAFHLFRRPDLQGSGMPAVGAILIALGCILAFAGSLVRKR